MGDRLSSCKVALIHMPIANPRLPNLAIERLVQELRAEGAKCQTLYGSLLFYPDLPVYLNYDSIAPFFFCPDILSGGRR